MVALNEVDDQLQQEVIDECSNYGKVEGCRIHTHPNAASEYEAVKIFVRFQDDLACQRGM
jgi:hypothetical protein